MSLQNSLNSINKNFKTNPKEQTDIKKKKKTEFEEHKLKALVEIEYQTQKEELDKNKKKKTQVNLVPLVTKYSNDNHIPKPQTYFSWRNGKGAKSSYLISDRSNDRNRNDTEPLEKMEKPVYIEREGERKGNKGW